LAETPDPDLALVNLEKVTASLGAKCVLWELFNFNPPSLKLYAWGPKGTDWDRAMWLSGSEQDPSKRRKFHNRILPTSSFRSCAA